MVDPNEQARLHYQHEIDEAKNVEQAIGKKLCDALHLNDAAGIKEFTGDLECNLAARKQDGQCLAELPEQHCPEPIPRLPEMEAAAHLSARCPW